MHPPADTPRLTFRELTRADLDFIAFLRADPEITRFYPGTYSREDSAEWIQKQLNRYKNDGYGMWLVSAIASQQPVGIVGLMTQDVDGVQEPEIGYIIHNSFWRQGLASEAALAVKGYAFDVLKKPRVISLIRPENIPSIGVAQKMGMTVEKRTMHAGIEHLVFSIRKDD
ncbi:MAG: GNAT family N-acetyltransferase [Ignavibacteriae bacterium]|nr:GNAT family N-acetyltransferase [Ignavibacteriota bacterium]